MKDNTRSINQTVRKEIQNFPGNANIAVCLRLLPMDLRTSSIRITGAETMMTKSHSLRVRGTMPNTLASTGTYIIRQWSPSEKDIAIRSQRFLHGGIVTKLLSSDSALSELNISIATRTDSDSVIAFTLPTEK